MDQCLYAAGVAHLLYLRIEGLWAAFFAQAQVMKLDSSPLEPLANSSLGPVTGLVLRP